MSCPEFIVKSFAVRDAAHLAHLASTSYSQHMALGTFYSDLLDLIDKYAEVYTGLEGKIPAYPSIKALKYEKPIDLMDYYLALVKKESKDDEHGSQALLNILAELEELTAQTLYKLRFLK